MRACRGWHIFLWIALTIVLAAFGDGGLAQENRASAASAASILRNGDFAGDTRRASTPDFWEPFAHEGRYAIRIDRAARPCLEVAGTAEGSGGRAGVFQKTPVLEAPAGFRIGCRTKGESGKRAVVLQFFDAQKPGEIADIVTLSVERKSAEFEDFTDEVAVPRQFRGRKIYIHFMLYFYGTGKCCWADARLEPMDRFLPKLVNTETSPTLLKPNPPDGAVAAQNPPDFRWRPGKGVLTYTMQLCQTPDFTGPTVLTFDGIRYNCFNLSKPLAGGDWFWRYSFVSEDGEKSNWSAVRSFKMPEGGPTFVLPPMEEVKRRIGADHPRIYVRKEDLDAFRRRKDGGAREWWANFERGLEARLKVEPAPEPADADLTKITKPIDLDYFKVDTKLRSAASQVADGLWNLAFAYLITGDRKYGDGAKKYLLHVSRWDPNGATSFASNDQVFRDIAIKSAMAYDWIYDTLSEQERKVVQESLSTRGRELYRRYAGSD